MAAPELQFLGTGTAFHTDGRGSQCILVRPGSGPAFLVDVGPTAMAAVMRHGVRSDEIDRLFVTHLHGDHVAGWPFLLLHLTFIDGRERPFHTHGPEGMRECLEGLMMLCYRDIVEGPKLGFEVHYHERPVVEATGIPAGAGRFDVVPMDHHPSSLGYVFEVDGRRVAVSGDTRWGDGLERLARASDLLIVECSSVARQPHAHLSLEEIRAGIDRLGDGEVVLIHLPDEVAAALAADPIPRVTASHDGMVYGL